MAAALADAAPTELAGADLIWRCLAGAVLPIAASRAMRWTWLVLAGVASAFTSGIGQVISVLGLAVAVGALLTARRDEVVGAGIGALAVNGLIRLEPIGAHGVPTLLALAACGPVIVSGYRYGTLAGRRLARGVMRGCGILALAVAVVTCGALVMARPHLEDGVEATRAGLAHVRAGDTAFAAGEFDRASRSFDRGAAIVEGPWVAPALLVPVLAQHVDATRDLARSGSGAVGPGGSAALVVGDESLTIRGGRVDLGAVRSAEAPLADALDGIDEALAAISRTGSPWLIPPVADRVESLRLDLTDSRGSVETAVLATQSVPSMLGAEGGRHYLVLVTTPAAAGEHDRSVHAWALATATDGQLLLTGAERSLLTDLGMAGLGPSLDFPSIARDASESLAPAGLGPVDGVLVLDPAALAAVVSLTGPVSLPQLNRPLQASEVESFLVTDQYDLFTDDHQRQDVLDSLVLATFAGLLGESAPGPANVVAAFDRPVAEGRVLVWTSNPDETALLRRVGLLH